MRLILAIAISLLLTGVAPAQSLVADTKDSSTALSTSSPRIFDQLFYSPASIGNSAGTRSVMPLWSTPDGRILAIVALGPDMSSLPTLSPAPRFASTPDLQLIDVTDFVSGGMGVKLRDNVGAYASFSQGVVLSPTNSTSLECNSALNLTLDSHCLITLPRGNDGSFHVGTTLQTDNVDLDLNYGLSWIHADDQNHLANAQQPFWDFLGAANSTGIPTLVIPGLELANLRNSSASATGHWHFDENQSLDLSAAVGRLQLELPGSVSLPNLNQAALSFGVHRGDFSGVVIGHVLGPADLLNSNQHWSSVDLGISWRSPWRGVFSVGAQNLWSSGNAPALVDPAAHEVDPSQARVPYVQYHQDL